MDCEKFESTLIDELYEELDELTSAAAKRHVAGCARCASLLSGLKATRRVAVLPILEPPADLEDRILAAARDAQKVVPMQRRLSRAISWAGSWAMRPQTAMAALFLLMIGSSALLLKGTAKAPASANVTVSAQGAPAPSAATGTIARPADLESADNAHGTPPAPVAPRAMSEVAAAPASPSLLPSPTATASGFVANNALSGPSGSLSDGLGRGYASSGGGGAPGGMKDIPADNSAFDDQDRARREQAQSPSNAGAVGGAPQQAFAQAPPPPMAKQEGESQASQAAATKKAAASSADFDSAMAQFKAGNYSEATRLFDIVGASGDLTAQLYAARGVEAQAGCSAAIGRYDQLASRAFGTTAGYDATLAAGRCFRILGDYERARQRLNRLLTVTTHMRLAQNELDALAPKAAAKPAARAAPAAPPPAKADTNQAY